MKKNALSTLPLVLLIAVYLDLGLRFVLAILIGMSGGYWLDSKLVTLPLFLVVGLLLGALSGFLTMYRAIYMHRLINLYRQYREKLPDHLQSLVSQK